METPSRAFTPGNDLLTSLMDRMISEPPASMAPSLRAGYKNKARPARGGTSPFRLCGSLRGTPRISWLRGTAYSPNGYSRTPRVPLPLGRIETRDGVLVDDEERDEVDRLNLLAGQDVAGEPEVRLRHEHKVLGDADSLIA